MKHLPIYTLLLFSVLSCKVNKIAATKQVTRDSVVIRFHDSVLTDTRSTEKEKIYVRDTEITQPGATAEHIIPARSVIPGNTFVKTSGHVHSTATIDSAGNIHIKCEADSLRTVIRALTEVVRQKENELSKRQSASTEKSAYRSESFSSTVTKVKSWTFRNWVPLLVFSLILVAIELLYRFFTRSRT